MSGLSLNSTRIFAWLESHPLPVLVAIVALTAALIPSLIFLVPDTEASTDPQGEVFETRDLVEERLVSPILETFWIVEARDGDMLTRDPLLELFNNSRALREDAELGPLLEQYQSANLGDTVIGIYSLADGVDANLRATGIEDGLEGATDDDVKVAVSELLKPGAATAELGNSLSMDNTLETREVNGQEIDYRVAEAIGVRVFADNEALGGGSFTVALGGDETALRKEQFNRDVRDVLRGDQEHLRAWGAGLDVNLSSEDEGATAGPFIAMAIIAVILVAGFVLRSYWAVALIGAALAILMVWLRGMGNLVGLDNSLLVSFIVPIAMISFGVDFAFHAIGRYREALEEGASTPGGAFVGGMAAVSGALLLALASDALAFLANVTAGIPAVIQFGIAATIALCGAYLLLGIAVPLFLMKIEERTGGAGSGKTGPGTWLAIFAAAIFAGLCVLLLIFFPPVGAAALVAYLAAFIAIPAWLASRRNPGGERAPSTEALKGHGGNIPWMGRQVALIASARLVVLPMAGVLTILSLISARNIEVAFDVKDFFSSSSDFVVSLDKLTEHISSGEQAVIYIEGDLTNPEKLALIGGLVEDIDESESGRFGRYSTGVLQVDEGALGIVRDAMSSPTAIEAIRAESGAELNDADGNGIPDTSADVAAIYAYARANGIPGESGLLVTPADVPSRLWESEDGELQATRLTVGLLGTREQANISAARAELEPLIDGLTAQLRAEVGSGRASLTGSPIARDAGLDATVQALVVSFPIAVVLCFVVALIFMRSLRYALVTIVPILVVVAWLYGFMALFDFRLNLVTATIGAISVGVGIDYAVHFTMRFREELARLGSRSAALEVAGTGTGAALFASAISSALGFMLMAFAPMPMFAAYGLLTAVMIGASALTSLFVLPSMLMLISRDPVPLAPPEMATQPVGLPGA